MGSDKSNLFDDIKRPSLAAANMEIIQQEAARLVKLRYENPESKQAARLLFARGCAGLSVKNSKHGEARRWVGTLFPSCRIRRLCFKRFLEPLWLHVWLAILGSILFGCKVDFQFPVIKLLDYQQRLPELSASHNPFAIVVMAHLAARRDDLD